MKLNMFLIVIFGMSSTLFGQTTIDIFSDSTQSAIGSKYQPGVFYVPKTTEAQNDFLNNGIRQNSVRLNIIEGALNTNSNLNDCLTYLDEISSILQDISIKTDKVLFIFEKMPGWLSSSTDGSPASTPGWFVLNTKPPSSYLNWDTMVVSIVSRIVNDYGIDNAYFEIWNEPDLGSWTGTEDDYFELFEHTYDAIKSVNTAIPVGGPATNHWGNNINYKPPYGYLSNSIADSSLIGQLIDSTYAWNKPLDFISWHNFDLTYQTNQNAIDYINQKYSSLGFVVPELIVSEWNTPSPIRDTPLQKSFFVKSQMEMAKTSIDNNMVAAWQDFNQSTNEFHNDYGLLTYGSIHKPAYNALILSNNLKGSKISNSSSAPVDMVTTISNDTLYVLICNYTPPAFIEAFNHTLFEGQFNANQIENAGYINIITNDLSQLDSIYQGLKTIQSSNSINTAINNSIPIYSHFDSLQTINRPFILNVFGLNGVHSGINYTIDSTSNNFQFDYDSLQIQGLSQASAITKITSNQSLEYKSVSLNNGQLSFSMQPNSIQLFQFVIPQILNINELRKELHILIHPNPTENSFRIESEEIIGEIQIFSTTGKILETLKFNETQSEISLSSYPPGVYFITLKDLNKTFKIIRK